MTWRSCYDEQSCRENMQAGPLARSYNISSVNALLNLTLCRMASEHARSTSSLDTSDGATHSNQDASNGTI